MGVHKNTYIIGSIAYQVNKINTLRKSSIDVLSMFIGIFANLSLTKTKKPPRKVVNI